MARGFQRGLLSLCIATASSLHVSQETSGTLETSGTSGVPGLSKHSVTCKNFCEGNKSSLCWCLGSWGCDKWQTDEWTYKGCCGLAHGNDYAPKCGCTDEMGNLRACTLDESETESKALATERPEEVNATNYHGITRIGLLAWQNAKNGTQIKCAEHARLCQGNGPFLCQHLEKSKVHSMETAPISRAGLKTAEKGPAGKIANQEAWCLAPEMASYAYKCQTGDYIMATSERWSRSYQGEYGDHALDVDAAYCNIQGHCQSEVFTETPVEDVDAICQEKYGNSLKKFNLQNYTNIVTSPTKTKGMPLFFAQGLLSCAMGNFKCDAVYCKRFFCFNKIYNTTSYNNSDLQDKIAHHEEEKHRNRQPATFGDFDLHR